MSVTRPPFGYVYEWHPDAEWTTDPARIGPLEGRRCRFPKCGRPAVAALNRGLTTSSGRVDSWWAYCEDHLYGRRLVDGVVLVRRTVPRPSRLRA